MLNQSKRLSSHCLATVRFSTYRAVATGKDIPVVHVGLMMPPSESHAGANGGVEKGQVVEQLEFEGELALDIWNYIERRWVLQRDESGTSGQMLVISTDTTAREQAEQELSESRTVLQVLYEAATQLQLSSTERFQQVLAIGCQYFNLNYGFLAEVEGYDFKIIAVQTPDNSLAAGEIYDLRQTYCLEALQQAEPLWIPHASASEWCHHPAYASLKMETYFGMRLLVNNNVYGVLSFCSKSPSPRQFRLLDKQLLQVMAQVVGSEIQCQQLLEPQVLRDREVKPS